MPANPTTNQHTNLVDKKRPVQRALFEIFLVLLPKLAAKPLKGLEFIQESGLRK